MRHRFHHLVLIQCLVASLAACSDTPAVTVPSDSGAVVDTGAAVDTGAVVTGCNTVPISAPAVTGVSATTMRPLPMGGTILDGTYFLTAHQTYDSPTAGVTYRTVLVIAGSRIELAQTRNGGPEERVTLTLTTTGIRFSARSECPAPGQSLSYDSFTATPTQLTLFDLPRVVTLTRQ